MFCARFFLFARRTALADSRFCVGMHPGMGLRMVLGGIIGGVTLGTDAGVVATLKIVARCLIVAICLVPR